jgi:outer membrane biosynthesis protein TonB
MPASLAPPQNKQAGSTGYIVAGVIMLLMTGGLIFWKSQKDASLEQPAVVQSVAPPQPSKAPVFEVAPPPPPPSAEPPKEEPKQAAATRAAPAGLGRTGCGGVCKGTAPPALRSALRGKAGQARGCYERALRQNSMLSGRLVVSVRVGPKGQVCSTGIASNTLGDSGVASCVVQIFRLARFPAPKGGCVDTHVPMNFVPKNG